MKKRLVCSLLVVVLALTAVFTFCACDKNDDNVRDYTIVYVGDSIAEALIGPSPLSERDNYGYFALIGRTNNIRYYNHSVSGHKTSTGIVSGDGLLEMLNKEDENAALMKTHLKQADMVHISVLGNNLLQYDLGLLMLEVADPDFKTKYDAGESLINALEDGSNHDNPPWRWSVDEVDGNGKPVKEEFDFPPTYQDICSIVARLRELNPDAKIVFQKVYNPFFEGSKHLTAKVKAKLAEITDDGRFGKQGEPIATVEQYRALADELLGKLNGLLDRYNDEHPNEKVIILDAQAEFERVAQTDRKQDGSVNYGANCLGRKLIYTDWTHPSNFGHAVIAGLTQNLLEELNVADPNAVNNYKAIRLEQIDRMYSEVSGFDAAKAKQNINNAKTYFDVTMAYFTAVEGFTPINY